METGVIIDHKLSGFQNGHQTVLDIRFKERSGAGPLEHQRSNELSLIRAMAPRFDAVVAAIFVRAASATGRLDLAPPVVSLLQELGRGSLRSNRPMVAAFFGSPYVPMSVPDLPAMLLTYDFSDMAEESAVQRGPRWSTSPDVRARAAPPLGSRM